MTATELATRIDTLAAQAGSRSARYRAKGRPINVVLHRDAAEALERITLTEGISQREAIRRALLAYVQGGAR